MSELQTVSLESYVHAAHRAVDLAIAAHAARAADIESASARAQRAHRVDALVAEARAALAARPMTQQELVSTLHARRVLVHDALETLLVRGEVTRTPAGYRLVHASAAA